MLYLMIVFLLCLPVQGIAASVSGAGGASVFGLGPNFNAASGNIITGSSEAKRVEIKGTGGQSANGVVIYQHSGGKMVVNCLVGGVEGACDKVVELNSGFSWLIKNSGGTTVLKFDESTGKFSTFTMNTEDTGVAFTVQEEAHWPVAGCQGATAGAIFDTPSSNAPAATCDTGTNTNKAYLAFDATTDESFQDQWVLPTGWTGSIDVHLRWKAAATTGSVAWCAQLVRVADGATSDPAFPAQATGNCVSDAAKGTTLQENAATIPGVTCTSCAAGDRIYVRISRDPDSTSTRTDDMSGDALLLSYGRTWRITK